MNNEHKSRRDSNLAKKREKRMKGGIGEKKLSQVVNQWRGRRKEEDTGKEEAEQLRGKRKR